MSWVTWPTWPPCQYMVKTLKKSTSPEAISQWPWNLVCSIVYASTTKVVQIVTLGWPWPILRQGQIWLHRLLYGRKWKWWFFFFWTYCSLRSQSCLKHSAKWVNEVEWVSKVKVILWPWSKVTQISKLNVWLLVCILRWAIQGLLALLFMWILCLAEDSLETSSLIFSKKQWKNIYECHLLQSWLVL